MTPEERSATALARIEAQLRAVVDDAAARAERHTSHYAELWNAVRAAAAGGKRIRPGLLVACHAELEGSGEGHVVRLGVAIELLHTALIVHDDIIDGDLRRRGASNLVGTFRASARAAGLPDARARRWGETAGILAGDLLLTAALRMAVLPGLDDERQRRIDALVDESVFRAAAGELADVAYAIGLGTPGMNEIREMMADKTAHYSLELPLRAAAVLAGAPADLEERLGVIGRSLGILFQMQDDLLGVFGRADETGKSTDGDLREGKQTMLIALARDTEPWRAAEHRFGDGRLDAEGAELLREALEASGARAGFEEEIRREHGRATRLIREAGLPAGLAATLTHAADRAMERRA